MMSQRETVLRKIRLVFPGRDEDDTLALLGTCGADLGDIEQCRLQLAILKLCDEEKLAEPTVYVEAAKRDFRDVLAWAESPNQLKAGPTQHAKRSEALRKMDRMQYRAWLAKT